NLIARSVNAEIEAHSLPGDLIARTVNGPIRISSAGHAPATTDHGTILAHRGRADLDGTHIFQTTHRAITLELPATLNAELEARTTNGSITTDFPIQVQGRIDRRKLSGSIGSGGDRRLEVKTVNGSIKIRRGGMP